MTLSPEDIHKKQFSYKMRGYNIDEVNDFLDQITKDYQIIAKQNKELDEKLKKAEHDLTYFEDLKNSLNQSILVAQEAADKVKKDAEMQAKEITDKAQEKADDLVSNATDDANNIMNDTSKQAKGLAVATDDFRDNVMTFRQEMIGMLKSQLDFAENDDWNKLLDSSNYENYDEIEKAIENIDKRAEASVESMGKGDAAVIVKTIDGNYDDPTVEIYPNK